ncbi:metallophosphoesterase [Bowmanella dokdonensis]|uniref:Metallophosphoesterase n=1 Tax=Bowmanella dokdonensis TaxID=751969 RepID=A0A939DMD8_9ALTE|nr:metallophosphoesterase [Bowmanella dokdonensis]MBN7825249.1 metallophosphoesterase [Bowmanella dokdonensis]
MRSMLLWAGAILLAACSDPQPGELFDGPYVFAEDDQWQALWVCQGQVKSYSFPPPEDTLHIEKCGLGASLPEEQASRPDLQYQNASRIAAISDIHGQFGLLDQLLKAHRIVDENGRWHFSDGHLVVVGDVFDRGPQVTESLWYLYRLDSQARKAGGRVHLLLGNHEVMVLNGDLRYLHDKYQEIETLLGKTQAELYGDGMVLGAWLRTRNVLVKINDMLFAHGGLHPKLAEDGLTLEQINDEFTAHLVEQEDSLRQGLARYLHKSDGPIWYRGYFEPPQASEAEIDLLLAHFGVKHLVVGHTTQEQVSGFFDNQIIAVDSGIKRGRSGEILLVGPDGLYRGLLDGSKVSL